MATDHKMGRRPIQQQQQQIKSTLHTNTQQPQKQHTNMKHMLKEVMTSFHTINREVDPWCVLDDGVSFLLHSNFNFTLI